MTIRPLVVGSLLAFITVSANARAFSEQEVRYSKQYQDCQASGEAKSTGDILDCIGAEQQRQEKMLNDVYRAVQSRLAGRAKVKLRNAQREWIKRREAMARKAADELGGGTASSVVFADVFLQETVRRIAWLQSYKG
jgi:uncharacterized protein YecT (DUF1311 family)